MHSLRRLLAVPGLVLLLALAGCVYGPAYPYPGYAYYGYYGPPVVTGGVFVGGGWWGRGCCYGGGYWRGR